MSRFQYKTVTLKYGFGLVSKTAPDLDAELNRQAQDGWRLLQVLVPAASLGESSGFILVLERPASEATS